MIRGAGLQTIIRDNCKVPDNDWEECICEHKRSGASLVRLMVARKLVEEEYLLRLLSGALCIPFVKLSKDIIDPAVAAEVPAKMALHYSFMPIGVRDGILFIAVNDPLQVFDLDEIGLFLKKRKVETVLATRKDILDSIKEFYGVGAETLEAMTQLEPLSAPEGPAPEARDRDIQSADEDPSVIRLFNQILQDAIKQRATDIHIEPFEDELRIRYRIDGVLYSIPCSASVKNFQASISSRIKVMASLDIAEKRRPQDGRIEIRMDGDIYDLRVSIVPTPYGESIGIRLLPRHTQIMGLEGLGLCAGELQTLEEAIKRPHGIILVTGPTGSGKTTTLYACLNTLNLPERKILTIEDPIEYRLKGITQMQAEPKVNFTFSNALRSMLRHDPDVMMVGEIRDKDTAELAVRTALTGHLVLSTLHTNDAAGGITRLLDMGIDPFLVSSSVILIIAQRLVRIICPACKTPVEAASLPDEAGKLRGVPVFRGAGCEACRKTGFYGRTGIFEMLKIDESIRAHILGKSPSHAIREAAISRGMRSLRQSGWEKVSSGVTTVGEVLRVTQDEVDHG